MSTIGRVVSVLPLLLAGACGPATVNVASTPETLAADSAIRAAVVLESRLESTELPQTSVGVLPLRVITTDTSLASLGFGLADLLMTDLARSGEVQVVDRLRIHALLRELALAESGLADTSSAPRLGRILRAQHLVAGQVAIDESDDVRFDTRLAQTSDGSVRALATGEASLDDILDAETALALRLFEALGVVLTPAEQAAIERRPTRNLGALLAFSRGVEAQAELRFVDAWRDYREALRLDRSFVEARDRVNELEATLPPPSWVASFSLDAINRPHLPAIADVTDPAFAGRDRATLFIPIIIP